LILFNIKVSKKEIKIEEEKIPEETKREINSFKNPDYGTILLLNE